MRLLSTKWYAVIAACPLLLHAQTVDFQREIRPVLSENCFQCHGPDAETRMANLRLDRKESALPVIQQGKLYQRITNPNPAQRMPPEYSHKALTPAQVAKIKLWIDQGAPWQAPWALTTPIKSPLPPVKNQTWARNPIDRFILARLEAKGLDPRTRRRSPHADPPRSPRPNRPPAHARRTRRIPQGHHPRRLRAHGRSLPRLAPLWRASRPLLARRRPLRRYPRHPYR